MKNRLIQHFKKKDKNLLSIYFTAGFPKLEDTTTIIQQLEKHGVDFLEVGMPFSDPLADGPTIQQSSMTALANGMSVEKLFEQLKSLPEETTIPIVLMGYLNPILQFGEKRFLETCKEAGVSGLIIPDLPLNYYETNWKSICETLGLSLIFLITPQTPEARIREIDRLSSGFIYMVSTNSLTGQNKTLSASNAYFDRVNKMNLENPLMIGFGIKDKETRMQASEKANGAIVGSAFIKALDLGDNLEESIDNFIKTLL